MSAVRRFTWMRLLLVLIVLLPMGWWAAEWLRPPRGAEEVAHEPLSLVLDADCGLCQHRGWRLKLSPDGVAVLWIPGRKAMRFQVSKAQIDDLREALLRERFFDLANEYGKFYFDIPQITLRVTAGAETQSVCIWDKGECWNWFELRRAARVMLLVQTWFDEPQIYDPRPELRRMAGVRE